MSEQLLNYWAVDYDLRQADFDNLTPAVGLVDWYETNEPVLVTITHQRNTNASRLRGVRGGAAANVRKTLQSGTVTINAPLNVDLFQWALKCMMTTDVVSGTPPDNIHTIIQPGITVVNPLLFTLFGATDRSNTATFFKYPGCTVVSIEISVSADEDTPSMAIEIMPDGQKIADPAVVVATPPAKEGDVLARTEISAQLWNANDLKDISNSYTIRFVADIEPRHPASSAFVRKHRYGGPDDSLGYSPRMEIEVNTDTDDGDFWEAARNVDPPTAGAFTWKIEKNANRYIDITAGSVIVGPEITPNFDGPYRTEDVTLQAHHFATDDSTFKVITGSAEQNILLP